jgi:hypothetical protein
MSFSVGERILTAVPIRVASNAILIGWPLKFSSDSYESKCCGPITATAIELQRLCAAQAERWRVAVGRYLSGRAKCFDLAEKMSLREAWSYTID